MAESASRIAMPAYGSSADTGASIRTARRAAGITQKELARRVGTQPSAISRLESGRNVARLRTLEKIAEALGLTLEWQLTTPHASANQRRVP
jgi:transcriptional regulator with XRE-family HTH domain